jgi:hypothetical protein
LYIWAVGALLPIYWALWSVGALSSSFSSTAF